LQHTKILIGFNTSSDDRRTLFPTWIDARN
jgi:hypothetical protein